LNSYTPKFKVGDLVKWRLPAKELGEAHNVFSKSELLRVDAVQFTRLGLSGSYDADWGYKFDVLRGDLENSRVGNRHGYLTAFWRSEFFDNIFELASPPKRRGFRF
jgi:hypothetical protein